MYAFPYILKTTLTTFHHTLTQIQLFLLLLLLAKLNFKETKKKKKKMYPDRQQGGGGAPHGILLAVVVAIVVIVPFLLGDQGEAITEAISELLSPLGLLLLPIILLLTIQFLSSERGSFVSAIFSTGEPDTIHRVSGSPFGVALFLVLILVLLYNRFSIFGGDDSDD